MIEQVGAIPGDLDRAKEANRLLSEMLGKLAPLADIRRDAVVRLHKSGMTYVQIGKELKISKMSAGRIASAKHRSKGQPDSQDGPRVDDPGSPS